MYTKVDGRICGVLNDFDLAIIVRPDEDRKPGEERTGTRIFMAGKLVENLGKNIEILHIYGSFMLGPRHALAKLTV